MFLYLKSGKKLIQIETLQNEENEEKRYYSAVTYIIVNNEETAAYCGFMNGFVIKYEITSSENSDSKDKWTPSYKVKAHSDEVKWINYNKTLCVIATCGYDGYVNIYKECDLKLIRSVYITGFNLDKVILVSSPLPSFIVYDLYNKNVRVFGLNTIKPIKEIDLQDIIVCYKIVKDFSFNEFIVYGNDKGEIVVKQLPFFEEIKREKVFKDNEFVHWIDLNENIKIVYAIGDNGDLAVLCSADFLYKMKNG